MPVRAGCGVSGRRERAARAGSAIEWREWTARAGGASGRRERAAREARGRADRAAAHAGGINGGVCRWGGIGKSRLTMRVWCR